MKGVFEPWIGQPVVLQMTLGGFRLSLRGKVLKEQEETLLVRPHCGPDLEVFKMRVLAIEEMCRWPRTGHARTTNLGSPISWT